MRLQRPPRFFYLRNKDTRQPVGALAFMVLPADQAMNEIAEKALRMDHINRVLGAPQDPKHVANIQAAMLANRPEVAGYGIRFAATMCHPNDHFEKRVARVRTLGKVESVIGTFFAAPDPDGPEASGLIPLPILVEDVLRVLRIPLRDSLDLAAANQLLTSMLTVEYARAVEENSSPAMAPRPEMPALPGALAPEDMH